MDNQNNLFNKIKSAAENAESKDFDSMEKVWSRIDAKLDTKVEKRNTQNWRKLAVAATVLIAGFVGYQLYTSEETQISPQNTVVTHEQPKAAISDSITNQNTVVSAEIQHPNIKENAEEVLSQQIAQPNAVAVQEENLDEKGSTVNEEDAFSIVPSVGNSSASSPASGTWLVDKNFESRGVYYKETKADEIGVVESKKIQTKKKKEEPLIVVNDLLTNKHSVDNLEDYEIESLIELPEPLYIINGVNYSEQELFGPNPTSPYTPLNKQVIETISILQDEKAVSIYGEKGKNGVVIITTKDGKPAPKKKE
jgi:TonB-dependent SusC/RagA subfamily outer membrane receptor